jgi:hypothetical protein
MDPMTGSFTDSSDTPRPKDAEGVAKTPHKMTDRMASKFTPAVNRRGRSAHRAVELSR